MEDQQKPHIDYESEQSSNRYCPALFIAAPASGQGKTLVTAAIARHHTRIGHKVRIFKTGPDYLDPKILETASGHPVLQLDLWMSGLNHCKYLLYQAAEDADLILIEGVMGLFDGDRSSADLATKLGIPIMAVIDASAMAQTFGALAFGLSNYRRDLPFSGVFANKVSSATHYDMLLDSLPEHIRSYGRLPKIAEISLPERHLGLVQADEVQDLTIRLDKASESLIDYTAILPDLVCFTPVEQPPIENNLQGHTIGIAYDPAFSFLYHDNVTTLESLGANITYFSPLNDKALPAVDALYLPGGYPELHAETLSNNTTLMHDIRQHHREGKPIVAECGGMMYVAQKITTADQNCFPMVGLLNANASMHNKLVGLGYHTAELDEGSLRGHSFHYSTLDSNDSAHSQTQPARQGRKEESIYRNRRLFASYIHLYFRSNPKTTAALFSQL